MPHWPNPDQTIVSLSHGKGPFNKPEPKFLKFLRRLARTRSVKRSISRYRAETRFRRKRPADPYLTGRVAWRAEPQHPPGDTPWHIHRPLMVRLDQQHVRRARARAREVNESKATVMTVRTASCRNRLLLLTDSSTCPNHLQYRRAVIGPSVIAFPDAFVQTRKYYRRRLRPRLAASRPNAPIKHSANVPGSGTPMSPIVMPTPGSLS